MNSLYVNFLINSCFFIKLSKIENQMDIKVVESENEIYQKQKLLGEGAFGKAYLVKRKADGQNLVIKEMNINHMSEQQKKQTIKEAQILRNLNHPNIVKFIQVYVTKQNKLKIVMEYAECGDLSKAISERKKNKSYFEQSWILDWFTQICLAIKHVHDRKILHRDIKGQNIFITKANTLKLGDFGIARVLNKTMQKARTVVGTPYYLSPQIIENKPYSFQSDIWSIGIVLYQLCALAHPFTANSLQFLALKIVKGSFNPIPSQYSKDLKSLVNAMLSLDPNKRPTINQIFKNPLIQDRIKNFLTQTKRDHQFSHTILHNHKVEILTNRLVQIKQQKDFQKERLKLKQQQEQLKQKMQQKKSQQRIKVQQSRQKQQRQRQMERQRQRQRSVEKQRLRQRQQQSRKQQIEKQRQRKQFERKQSLLQQQRRNQQQQRKLQRQYQQKKNMAKYYQQKRKQEDQVQRLRREHAQLLYCQNERQDQLRKAQKMKKAQQKQFQEEKKKKQLQQFARKQFFENQQIMRRAKQRAQQQQAGYNNDSYQPKQSPRQIQKKPQSMERRKTADNFHYQNKKNQQYQPSTEQVQNAYLNPNFSKNSSKGQIKTKSTDNSSKQSSNSSNKFSPRQDLLEKQQNKYVSARQQMKKDRQNFLKIKNLPKDEYKNQNLQINEGNLKEKKDFKTIKAAKWQRPSSRGNEVQEKQISSLQENVHQKQDEGEIQKADSVQWNTEQTYEFMHQKISPKDQQNFNEYLLELQNLLQNMNKNVEQMQNNQKKSPRKIMEQQKIQLQKPLQMQRDQNQRKQKLYQNDILADMPEQDEVVYRDDDQNTFQLSLTAEFKKELQKKQIPQIEASTDLDYFSNFSKLETLRMNLEDKFGTDNFVQLYRFLENQMQQKGLQGFSNVNNMVQQASSKFLIDENLLMDSFTLLLTLIHMQQKMMSNH